MKWRGSIKQPVLFIVALLIFGSTAVNSPAMAEPGQAAAPSFHPTGNLTLYPDTPLPTYTTIKPLESIYRRTPNAAVIGGSTLDQRFTHDQSVVDNFNRYLLELQNLESQNNGVTVPTTDIQAVLGSEALHSILQNASSTDSLLAIAQHESTPATTAAGIFLLLSLGLSTWALLYHEAEQKHLQQQLAALVPQEKLNQTFPKPLLTPPHLYRLPDWVDPNGIHFHRYGMAVNGVWHDIADNSEVEKIFGRDNDIPPVDRGAYTIGWDPVHGGGTVGGDMPLRELWQMQSEVIHDGTLAQTPEQYARGETGTNHPLGWTFQPTQMYNPQDRTIYIVDQGSQGKFYDHLGWLAVSSDTPKNKISSLAFDTPTAFTEQIPWTQPFDSSLLLYQPNHIYQNLMPTDFQNYFQEQKQAGRSTESIYENNPLKKVSYTAAVAPTTAYPPTPTHTWNIPFRSGLTQVQKDSIINLFNTRTNENRGLNETDARNYAYAVGVTNWYSFVGKRPVEITFVTADFDPAITALMSPVQKTSDTVSEPDLMTEAKLPNSLAARVTDSFNSVVAKITNSLPTISKTAKALAASALLITTVATATFIENNTLGAIKTDKGLPTTTEAVLGKTIGNTASYLSAGLEFLSGGGLFGSGLALAPVAVAGAPLTLGVSAVADGVALVKGAALMAHGAGVVGYTAGKDVPNESDDSIIVVPAPGEVVTDLSKIPPVYRGGSEMVPRAIDVKFDEQGFVKRGVSLNADPSKLTSFGKAYQIKSLPDGLGVVQSINNANHFEIVSTLPMSFEKYSELLKGVIFH